MQSPTIVKQTKDYLIIKVPLPRRTDLSATAQESPQMTKAEKRLWKIIQDGEKEYREGKTIQARSVNEAMKIYERRRKNKKH